MCPCRGFLWMLSAACVWTPEPVPTVGWDARYADLCRTITIALVVGYNENCNAGAGLP